MDFFVCHPVADEWLWDPASGGELPLVHATAPHAIGTARRHLARLSRAGLNTFVEIRRYERDPRTDFDAPSQPHLIVNADGATSQPPQFTEREQQAVRAGLAWHDAQSAAGRYGARTAERFITHLTGAGYSEPTAQTAVDELARFGYVAGR